MPGTKSFYLRCFVHSDQLIKIRLPADFLFCVSGSYIVVILLFFHCRPFLCLLLFLFFLSGFVIRYDVFQRPYGKGFFPFEAFKIDLFDELRQGRFPSFLLMVVNLP